MDEILETREQPNTQMTQEEIITEVESAKEAEPQKIKNMVDNGVGSLGKFKDAQSLLSAYNSLQAEFTKKCQSLSEVTKQLKDKMPEQNLEQVDNKTLIEEVLPIYKREDWTNKVGEFLEKNQQAKPYARQISEIILSDDNIAKSDSALDIAFAKAISSKFVSPETMVEDDKFVSEYVLKSEKVKDAVLKLYLDELNKNKAPALLGQTPFSKEVLHTQRQASSLSEAKDMVRKLFI